MFGRRYGRGNGGGGGLVRGPRRGGVNRGYARGPPYPGYGGLGYGGLGYGGYLGRRRRRRHHHHGLLNGLIPRLAILPLAFYEKKSNESDMGYEDGGGEAALQTGDDALGAAGDERLLERGLGDLRALHHEVVAQGAGEQEVLLQHEAGAGAQLGEVEQRRQRGRFGFRLVRHS